MKDKDRSSRDFFTVAGISCALAFAALGFVLSSIKPPPHLSIELSAWTFFSILIGAVSGWLPWRLVQSRPVRSQRWVGLIILVPVLGCVIALSASTSEIHRGMAMGVAAVAFAVAFFTTIIRFVGRGETPPTQD